MIFLSFRVLKVAKVGVSESLLVSFLDYGKIVSIELSLGRQLNLEGWRGSEIIQILVLFGNLFQNL